MKKFLFLIFSLLCLVAVTSCKDQTQKDPPVEEVQKIVVTFDSKGGSNVKSAEIEKGSKVTKPTDPVKQGYTFAGWYTKENCSADSQFNFDIELEVATTLYAKWDEVVVPAAKVVSIEIKKQPDKTTYIEGELFDKTGMVVEATYDDDSKKEITDYMVMPNGEVSLGLEMFSVTYGDFEEFGSITVVAKEILSVEVETLPVKTTYKNYETFDPTGLVLKVSYNNGKFDLVDSNIKYDRGILLSATDTMKVTWNGLEVNVPITVTKIPHYGVPNQKESIYVDAKALVEQLTPLGQIDGNRVTGTATFGDIQIVASAGRVMQWEGVGTGESKYNYHVFDHDFEGMIKFGGVTSPEGRYLIVTPTENGELRILASRPSAGVSSFVIYDRYDETTLPDSAKQIIELDIDTECIIPVYIGETYYITVSSNAFIKGMALVYNPTYYEISDFNIDTANVVKDFAVGQKFNSNGLTASVKLPNNETATLKESQYEVVLPDMTTAGVKTVTVKYQGLLEKTYDITLHELTGIEVTKLPTKFEYFAGEDLEVAGLEVSAVAGDVKYAIKDYTISKTTALAVGDVIKVEWKGFDAALEVVIKENPVTGIRVKTAPTKTTYNAGEAFDSTGLVIEVIYEGRDPETLESLADVTFSKSVLAIGDTVVVASWGIFDCEIQVVVVQVDWYEKDDTTYIKTTDILKAYGQTDETAWSTATGTFPTEEATINEFYFNCTGAAFQYQNITTEYIYDGFSYQGAFRTGDTREGRYIRIIPTQDGTLTLYAAAAAGNALYLVNSLVKPNPEDSTTYVAVFNEFSGTGSAGWKTVVFELEADQTYYLWFYANAQHYIRGMNLSYGKVNTIVEELVLDTTDVKTSFEVGEDFVSENLKVSVRCADGGTYELSADEYTVTAPDMSAAGTKTVEVKFGDVTVKTYEIVIA